MRSLCAYTNLKRNGTKVLIEYSFTVRQLKQTAKEPVMKAVLFWGDGSTILIAEPPRFRT